MNKKKYMIFDGITKILAVLLIIATILSAKTLPTYMTIISIGHALLYLLNKTTD